MAIETEIQIREKCINCGNGVLASPEWVAWNKGYDTWRDQFPTAAQTQPWPNDYERENPMPNRSEEYPCPECEGTTWIYRWIAVNDLVVDHQVPIIR